MSSFFHYFQKDNFAEYIIISWQLIFPLVQLLSCIWLFATQWTAAHQPSLSIRNSRSLLKVMSIELVMPSKHLILCWRLLLSPSVFLSIRVFSSESALCIRRPTVIALAWLQTWVKRLLVCKAKREIQLYSFLFNSLWLEVPGGTGMGNNKTSS